MSVVGPRAVWTTEEPYSKRKPVCTRNDGSSSRGVTRLAQINDASSVKPEIKLHYDLQYVRERSFKYDLKIVARQI